MWNPKRFLALITGLVIGVGAIVTIQSIRSDPGIRREPRPAALNQQGTQLVGQEFAESLGLPTIPKLSAECEYAAEAPPGNVLYCLDTVVDNDVEARLIGWRINGRIPSEEEEKLAELFSQEAAILQDAPENEAQLLEIRNQIAELMEQIGLQKDAG